MKPTLIHQPQISRRETMKGGIGAASLVAMSAGVAVPAAVLTVSVVAATDTGHAQQASSSEQVTQPATGVLMHPGYARTIAQMAYV
jgi:hypothetical protein